jgi:hypothetical protein
MFIIETPLLVALLVKLSSASLPLTGEGLLYRMEESLFNLLSKFLEENMNFSIFFFIFFFTPLDYCINS